MRKVTLTDDQWRAQLTPEQYAVLREQGTERPFTGEYVDTTEPGVYKCAGCGTQLFGADDKFDHGCGWPSFSDVIDGGAVETRADNSLLMRRTEVVCAACGGHLGHVFDDGPKDRGGLRYCINSVAIQHTPESPRT